MIVLTRTLAALITFAALYALYLAWRTRCAWCARPWAVWIRTVGAGSMAREFPICRRCRRASPSERIRTVRPAPRHHRVRA